MIPDGDGYHCNRCPTRTADPRYRITVYASDVSRLEPDAPPVELLFFGEVGQSLAGKPAMLLVANARGQQTYVPPELISLTGGKYDLIVEMSLASLQSESPSFRVRAIVGNDNGPLHHSPPGDIGQSASGSFQELGSTGSTATLVATASNVLTTYVTTAMLAPSIATPPPQTTPPSVSKLDTTKKLSSNILTDVDIGPDDHLSCCISCEYRQEKDCFYSWQTFVS